MGRRALPKIDETLDLSRHFYKVETLPAPWNPAAIFGREAPLEIELGSGKGLFLQNAALGTPERDFLGVEVAYKYAKFIGHRLAKRNITNAVAVHGDGLKMFREQVPDASLAAIHVYFPDPWWKKRHRKRRVMNEPMVRDIERTLLPGGKLHFWSDVEEYFQSTLELLAAETKLEGPLPVEERPAEHHLDYRTHFERRKRLDGLPIYRAEYVKRK